MVAAYNLSVHVGVPVWTSQPAVLEDLSLKFDEENAKFKQYSYTFATFNIGVSGMLWTVNIGARCRVSTD